MTEHRESEPKNSVLNLAAVIDYLSSTGDICLQAVDASGKSFTLVLNSNGQLCYREGKTIRLLSNLSILSLVLTEESSQLLEKNRQADKNETTRVNYGDADTLRLARSYNAIMRGLAGIVDEKIAIRQKLEIQALPKADTIFSLDNPKQYQHGEQLARAYFEAVMKSINERWTSLMEQGFDAKKIFTEGSIIPYGATRDEFEKKIKAYNGMRYYILDSSQSFVKYRILYKPNSPRYRLSP